MTLPHRRRRVQPLRKPAKTIQPRKRSVKKTKSDWKSNLIRFFIGLVLMIDLVLIFYIVKQCSNETVIPVDQKRVEEVIQILQIEVLNGCGVKDVAAHFTDYLRMQGFDVVRTDNYESFNLSETVIIDRRGNKENGARIARALGLGEERVIQEINEDFMNDATVIIGKDFQSLKGWKSIE